MAMTDSKETCLSKNTLFKEIPKEKLSEIARDAHSKVVAPATIIFREGDSGDDFYMINSGKVRLSKKGRGGIEISFATLGPGDFFGHLSILTDDLRSVNVEALEETHLTILSRGQFDAILKAYPDAAFAFAKQMSGYLAKNIQVIKKKAERRFQASRTSWIDFLVIFTLSLLCGIIFNYSNPNGIRLVPEYPENQVAHVEPSPVMAKQAEVGTVFVDARPSTLYKQMHIKGAVNIPLALFDIMYMVEFSKIDKKKDIVVYGRTISRHYDESVAGKLILRGYENLMILKGGLSAWKEKGYPVMP